MIVISTYNGYWPLSNLIKALEEYGTNGHKVVVMDNGSKDLISKKYLTELSSYIGKLDIVVERAETSFGYEAGAFVHAVRRYPEERTAILLQDSCLPTSKLWLQQFEDKLTEQVDMVSWVKFRPCLFFCYEKELAYIDSVAGGHDNVPDGGCFGNIFYCRTSVIKDLDSKGYFQHLPTEKLHSECWERLWPILFHINGYQIECIIDEFNPNAIHYGQYPHLKKTFSGRK